MCLAGAGGPPVNGFGDEGPQACGPERPGTGDADGPGPGLTLGCAGCAEAGYCRRGPGSGGPSDRLHGARRARCDLVGCAGAVRVRRIGEHCGNTYLDSAPG
jgi:hypothetical protein